MSIAANLLEINQQIETACARANRARGEVRLIAVTKTITASRINEALQAGVCDIGENRVQEAETKFHELTAPVEKHLIGHLQANKARRAVELFDYIHSLDSIKLAERLERIAVELNRDIVVLAQVDLGKEETKSGIDEAELPALVEFLAGCRKLQLRGLMTVPPYFEDPEAVRPYFRRLRELRDELNQHKIGNLNAPLTELSMGMSHDFPVAIEEGATLIRIGTAIFGERGK